MGREIQDRCYTDSQNTLTMLEIGFDARIDDGGRLHIQTNNPTGCVIQTLTLGPEATRELVGLLLKHVNFGPISI